MAETLSTLSIISFIIAGVCLALAIFLCIFFRIPSVIGDLTGRTARKSIAKMRSANEKTGNKNYKTSKINAEREKLTDTMSGIGSKKDDLEMPETGLLSENKVKQLDTAETGILETEKISTVDLEATSLLESGDFTMILDEIKQEKTKRESTKKIVMKEEVMLIHTDEVIN